MCHCCSQLKAAEPHAVVSVAGGLVAEGRPLEVQHFGFQLLQHLVRHALASETHANAPHLCAAVLEVLAAPSRRTPAPARQVGVRWDDSSDCEHLLLATLAPKPKAEPEPKPDP